VFVFEYRSAGDLTLDYFAENTVVHISVL
jgi:hypothetical protein